MMENNYFFKKTYFKTQRKKKDVLVIILLPETKNSNLYLFITKTVLRKSNTERQMPYST